MQELLVSDDKDHGQAVAEQLTQQHALHGLFADVFMELGGRDFIRDWAVDNPGRFINLLTKMTPGLAPTQQVQGDVHLHVHNSLGPTELDHQE